MFGHHHLNVTNIETHTRFFAETLGGAPAAAGSSSDAIVKFPNGLIVLRGQAPSGGTKGTIVNHFPFGVQHIREMVDRVKAAGWRMVTREDTPPEQTVKDDLAFMTDQQTDVAFIMAPDDTRVELIEIGNQPTPIALHHIHFLTPQVEAMNINLTYSPTPSPVVGTHGRALDHIGFEVKDLAALCLKIEGLA